MYGVGTGFANTFRWMLNTVQDQRGNTVTYGYTCVDSDCYLNTVSYNGTVVTFYRESRPDPIKFANGSYIGTTNYRLKSIAVRVGGSLARAYKLTYTTSANTGHSILASVQQYGKNATVDGSGNVSGGTSLPAMSMSYNTAAMSFPTTQSWPTGYAAMGDGESAWTNPSGVEFADFNGDGLLDIAWSLYECNGWWGAGCQAHNNIWLNAGNAFVAGPAWPTGGYIAMGLGSGYQTRASGAELADMNGDGKTDVVWSLYECNDWYGAGCQGHNEIKLSTGTGFRAGPAWPTGGFLAMSGNKTVSLSGYLSTVNTAHTMQLVAGQGNRLDWYNYDGVSSVFLGGSINLAGFQAYGAPGNGDPVTYRSLNRIVGSGNHLDVYKWYSCCGTDYEYYVGAINLYGATASGECWPQAMGGTVQGQGNQLACTQYLCDFFPPYTCSPYGTTYLNFAPDPPYEVSDGGVRLVDANGDGITDVAWSLYECNGWYGTGCQGHQEIKLGGGGQDLMSTLNNGMGGSTTITYKPSTAWANTLMPAGLIAPTVSSLTTSDGRGHSSTVNYSYSGGLWSFAERRFLGFRYVKGVIDAAGNYTETYYRQKEGSIAKPETTYLKNSAGQIFSYSSMAYTENTSPPYTSLLTERWDYECNLSTACRRTLVQFVYDTYGNVTQSKEYGDYDVSGDERTIVRGYYPNTAAGKYIVGLPAYQNVFAGIGTGGTLLQQTLNIYDGNADYNVAPTVGNLKKVKQWNSQAGGHVVSTLAYDAYGNVTSQADERGKTQTATFDSTYHTFVTQECNALSQCTTHTWDTVLGLKLTSTDANAATLTYTYDALGRTTQVKYPDNSTATYSYLNWGDPTLQRVKELLQDGSGDGLWTEQYQDGLGRVYKVTREGGVIQEKIYSGISDRVWKESYPYKSGETVRWVVYTYDGAMRPRTTTNPDGTVAEIVYANDANGKPYTTAYDELDNQRVVWKDAYGNTTQVREKNGSSYYYTTYQYDLLGHLTRVTDNAGNATTFSWNSLGHKLTMNDPDMGAWSYTYDNGGLLLSQKDAKNQTITFTYDALGRVKTKLAGGQTTTWYYDEASYGSSIGRLTRVVYPDGSEKHWWNLRGLENKVERCVSGECQTVSSTYDAMGRLKTITYPDGEVVTYTYDAEGNLSGVSNYVTSFVWDARGQLTQINYSNGTTANYSYSATRLWLSTANVKKGTTTLYTASYTYDNAARVTSMTQGTPTAATLNFTYDSLNRLTGVSGAQTETWAYNAIGNITSGPLGAYTYGNAAHKHAATKVGSTTFTYDANGNMLTQSGTDTRTFTWDAQNRLDAMVHNGTSIDYAYGAGEERIQKVSDGVTTKYFGGMVETVNGARTQYVYAGAILVARKEAGGAKYWYHADRLGSTRLMTNASGVEVKDYDYTPFGSTSASSGSITNERQFTGHVNDAENGGLIYMGARYYQPGMGRFISADPVVPNGENPQALNRYSYGYNNPISNVDPTGHAPVAAAVLVVVSVGAATGFTGIIFAVAVIGACISVAGYFLKNPLLSTIGGVMLGFASGWIGGLPGLSGAASSWAGGLLGASVAAATSPLSPLDPALKQAIGWAYTAFGIFRNIQAAARGSTPASGGKISLARLRDEDGLVTRAWRLGGRPSWAPDSIKGTYYVTGWFTDGWRGLGNYIADTWRCLHGHLTPTQQAILTDMARMGWQPSEVLVIGHSLGSMDAIALGLSGQVDYVVGFGVPGDTLAQALKSPIPADVTMSLFVGSADPITWNVKTVSMNIVGPMLTAKAAATPNLSFTVLQGLGHAIAPFCQASGGYACMPGVSTSSNYTGGGF